MPIAALPQKMRELQKKRLERTKQPQKGLPKSAGSQARRRDGCFQRGKKPRESGTAAGSQHENVPTPPFSSFVLASKTASSISHSSYYRGVILRRNEATLQVFNNNRFGRFRFVLLIVGKRKGLQKQLYLIPVEQTHVATNKGTSARWNSP